MIDALITFLPVRDLERTHTFYHGVLGLELARDQGTTRIYRVANQAFVGFTQGVPQAKSGVILSLVVEPDLWHARLMAAAVPTDGPPRDNPRYKIRHFFAFDPDGYRIEFQTMF